MPIFPRRRRNQSSETAHLAATIDDQVAELRRNTAALRKALEVITEEIDERDEPERDRHE